MTEDPKAPGAAAVCLYHEEKIEDNLRFHSYYERIKILTEKGKETATVRIPYIHSMFKVTNIHGRTIHPDGTVVPLTAKPSDLTDVKSPGYQKNTMVFTLPSVEVGSILEYRLEIQYDEGHNFLPVWIVQRPYFIHAAHFFFASSGGFVLYNAHVGNGAQVRGDVLGHYTLDVADVPPIPSEDWMPPVNSITWRVIFYYTSRTREDLWAYQSKYWASETEKFDNPTKTLKQAAANIVGAGDTEDQKARKLYAAVMKLDNASFSRQKSEAERKNEKLKPIRSAEDVWNQQSGTDDEIALLFVALARAAGLRAYPAQVVDRSRAVFDVEFLSLSQLNDYIAIVVINGKDAYFDPGQKMCPFGQLHWKHTLATGLRVTDNGPASVTTPAMPYTSTGIDRDASLTISADGSVSGSIRCILSGTNALHWRQISLDNDEDEVKKQFSEAVQGDLPSGVYADFDHFLALGDYNDNLIAVLKVTGNIGVVTGKHFLLPGFFFQARAEHPFVSQDKRETPIDMHFAQVQQDEVTFHFPPGYTVQSAPKAADASWPGKAILKTGFNTLPDGAYLTRTLAYNFVLLAPSDYPNLHDFYQKVAMSDQQPLVLNNPNNSSDAQGH